METAHAPYVPLESGDRLSRAEFHRRYCLRPDIKKAELISGMVYVPSPARYAYHDRQQQLMYLWIVTYSFDDPGLATSLNATIFLTDDGEVQTDVALFRIDQEGATIHLDDEGYLVGTPDLVVEIAASSAAYDLHDKMELYRLAGVPEYIVWQVLENRIDWFVLQDGAYVPHPPDANGIIESRRFPGLRLAVDRMLALDRSAVLATLDTDH
jgi:hypothetical protein